MPTELPTNAAELAERLAQAARTRSMSAERAVNERALMSPEEAARDEFDAEALTYQLLGAIEVFSNNTPRVPSDEIAMSPARAAYICERGEEIRQERDSQNRIVAACETAALAPETSKPTK